MPEPMTVAALHAHAKALSEDEFRERFGDAFFMRGGGSASLRKPRVFQETSKGDASPALRAAEHGASPNPLKRRAGADVMEFTIYFLRPNDPKGRRVTVGRTGNNDVVIADSSVSKFHAVITRDAAGGVQVKDASSTTGTRINDELIPADEYRTLKGGEEVAFGEVHLTFLGVTSLHNFLKRVIPPPNPVSQ
ncbi:MAG: FHA domain-containing protein [Deltaproteobacteria bacterium]|nr:FHA domain-containing protein [Deltaproteobacteria bacterium]